MASKALPSTNALDGFEDDGGDDLHFHNACLEEIDRYRRMDEWIPSHHNVLSTTALECRRILMQAGIISINLADFLQYTSEGTSEYLRLCAFTNLMDLGMLSKDKILRWFLFVLSTDPSPFTREHLQRLFGQFLGSIAVGEHLETAKAQEAIQDGLVIEQETTTEARKAELARKQTIEGATTALKSELSSKEVLKTEIWNAVTSPTISLNHMGDLLEICDLLYNPETSMVVSLKYPHYWSCTKIGKGKLRFSRTSRIRTAPQPHLQQQHSQQQPPPPSNIYPWAPSPSPIKRENSNSSSTAMAPPPPQRQPLILKLGKRTPTATGPPTPAPLESIPPTPASSTPTEEGSKPQKIKLKFKVPGAGSPPPSA